MLRNPEESDAPVNHPNPFQVSDLTAEDLLELEDLECATHLSFWGAENYSKFLQQPEYFARKAVAQTTAGMILLGFFLARSVLENLELLKIGVYPQFQSQGIGACLLEAVFEEGTRRRCLRCFLEVRKSNAAAVRFYLNHEFKMAGERINYYTEPAEDAWIMERTLQGVS
jgi:ribosomal-protein-alanine N-acetyltransferase